MRDREQAEDPDAPRITDADELAVLLRERDARERVFESFPDAVLLTDVDGRIRDANLAALSLLGRSAEDVFGRPIDEIVVEEPDGGGEISRLTRAGVWKGRVQAVRADGSRLDLLARSMVLAGVDEPMHLLVLVDLPSDPLADALLAAEERLSAIVESATDAIVSVDRTQRIVVFNAAAEEMFRCPAAEAIGQPLERFIPAHLREAHRGHVDEFASTGRTRRRMGHLLGTLMAERADGERFPIEATISRVDGPEGPLLTAIVRDVSERLRLEEERARLAAAERRAWSETHRVEERARRLQAITDAALAHLSLDDLFAELLGRLSDLLGTDEATVLLLDRQANVLRVRAMHGLPRAPEEVNEVPLGVGVAGRIAAAAKPVVIDDLRHVRPVSPFLRRRLRSLVGVPIVHEGTAIGVLHVASVHQRAFSSEDVALLELVASRLAPVIENARLHEAERAARLAAEADASRSRISSSIAEALTRVLPLQDTSEEIIRHVAPALGAVAAAVGLVDDERANVHIVAATGFSTEILDRFASIALDDRSPIARAILAAEPVFLSSIAERDEAFPALAGTDPVGRSWAALPLVVDGTSIGALALSFPDPRPFETSDRGLMRMLAHQCALALDRSRVHERERQALQRAEAAGRRLALLQTLTARFSRALTSDEVARIAVTQAAAALGARSGVVLLLDGANDVLVLGAAHGYSEQALAGWERFPVDLSTPAGEAVRTGRPVVVESVEAMTERYPAVAPSMTDRSMGLTAVVPILVNDRALGAVGFTFPPGHELSSADRELLSALGRHAGQALERARLFETERLARHDAERARERTERLQTLTEALVDADTMPGVLDVLVDQSLAALGAVAALVVRLDDDGVLEMTAARGYPADVLGDWRRFSVDDGVPLAQAVRTRSSVWLASGEETAAAFPLVGPVLRHLGHDGASAAIPLTMGDRTLGGLALQFAERRHWDDEDRELLHAIARQCSQAWFRAQLHEAEVASRRELRRSERRYRSLVQATSAVEWTVDPAGAFVERQPSWEAFTGQAWEEHRGLGWLNAVHPDDQATTRARWFAARDAHEVFEASLRLWHAASGEHHHAVARAAPVRDDLGRVVEWVGTIVDVHEQHLAEMASTERERESREGLQLAGGRLAFLAEASGVLASSLLVDETLQRLSDLVVPRLADWCAIDVIGPDGSIDLVAVSHVDPAKTELARELRQRFPPQPDAPTGVPNVVRTGRSELIAEIPPELVELAAEGQPEIVELVRDLQLRSVMTVPLGVGKRTFGAITFVWAESGRTYTQEDLALAEDLAHRASVAVENARLFEAERTARMEEAEAQHRLRILAEVGSAMASSLDQRVVVSAMTRVLARELSDWSAVFLVGRNDRVVDAIGAHRDPQLDGVVQRLITARFPDQDNPHSLVGRVLRTGTQVLAPRLSGSDLRGIMAPGEQLELANRVGMSSVVAVPLTARGRIAGALVTVRDASSPPFDTDDVDLMMEIGRRAALALENSQLYAEREYVADTLQRSLLPPDLPSIPGLEIGARYLPASEGTSVGGDFYDVFETDLDHWAAVIGDVVGKGAAAAAMMGLARYTIRTAAMSESRPSAILGTLNEAILRQTAEQRFCTACCLRIMRRNDATRVTISTGGHPLPLLLRSDGSLETVGEPGTLLGVFEDPTLTDDAIDMERGDALVLYTDGVTDERRGDEEFGEARLAEVLRSLAGQTAQAIADEIVRAVVGFRSERPRDDIAILVLRMAR